MDERRLRELLRVINLLMLSYLTALLPLLLVTAPEPWLFVHALPVPLFVLVTEGLQESGRKFAVYFGTRLLLFIGFLALSYLLTAFPLTAGSYMLRSRQWLSLLSCFALMLITAGLSLERRLSGRRFLYPALSVTLFFIPWWLAAAYVGSSAALLVSSAGILLEIPLMAACEALNTLIEEYEILEDSESLPYARIRRTTGVFLGIFLAVSFVSIALVLYFKETRDFILLLRDGFLFLLRQLLRFLFFLASLFPSAAPEIVETPGEAELMPQPSAEANPILSVILEILSWALAIAALVLLSILIFRVIRAFIRHFNNIPVPESRDVSENLLTDRKEKLPRNGRRKRSRTPFSALAPRTANETIRLSWKRLLKNAAGDPSLLKPTLSPSELEKAVFPAASVPSGTVPADAVSTDALARVHTLYEEARYSGKILSRADAAAMKQAAGQIAKK